MFQFFTIISAFFVAYFSFYTGLLFIASYKQRHFKRKSYKAQ